jgi:DNA-binding ferritin-like protein (Dps family)
MQRKPVAPAPRITSEQLADLRAALDVTGSDIAKFCDVMKVEALPDLTQEQYTAAQRLLAKKLSKAKPQALEAAE